MYNIETFINWKNYKNSTCVSNKVYLEKALKAFSTKNKPILKNIFQGYAYNKNITFIFNKGYRVVWLLEYPWLFRLESDKIIVNLISDIKQEFKLRAVVKSCRSENFKSNYKLLIRHLNDIKALNKSNIFDLFNYDKVLLKKFLLFRKSKSANISKKKYLSDVYFSFLSYAGTKYLVKMHKWVDIKDLVKSNIDISSIRGNDVSFLNRLVGLKCLIKLIKLFVFWQLYLLKYIINYYYKTSLNIWLRFLFLKKQWIITNLYLFCNYSYKINKFIIHNYNWIYAFEDILFVYNASKVHLMNKLQLIYFGSLFTGSYQVLVNTTLDQTINLHVDCLYEFPQL